MKPPRNAVRPRSMRSVAFSLTCASLLLSACGDDTSAGSGGAGSSGEGGATSGSPTSGSSSTDSTASTGAGGAGGEASVGPVCDVADPSARDAACSAFADAACDYELRCSPGLTEYFWGSRAACVAVQRASCLGLRNVDEEAVLGCYAAVTAALGADDCSGNPYGETGESCYGLGTLGDGEPCWGNLECASGHCSGDAECRACAPAPAEGDACVSNCGQRLRCVGNLCVSPPVEGEACGGVLRRCDDGSVCASGTCRRRTIVGQGDECSGATAWCDPALGLVCEDGVCVPHVGSDAGDGAPCEEAASSYFGLPQLDWLSCADGLRCDFSTQRCGVPGATGDACLENQECASFLCSGGVCADTVQCACASQG
jgi:hypothetical protein